MYTRKLKHDNGDQTHYGYEFNTFISFNWGGRRPLIKCYKKKGVKYINKDLVNYITPLALAIWISDDGGFAKPGVRLATGLRKKEDIDKLIDILKTCFGFNFYSFQYNKSSFGLGIADDSKDSFITLIEPYLYKIKKECKKKK